MPVRPDTRRLHLSGRNLIGEDGPPRVRLNNQELGLAEAEDDRLVVELPEQVETGALEIELPDGEVLTYSLSLTPDPSAASASHGNGGGADQYDPWEPGNGEV